MTDLVVIGHCHDEDAGVFRLVFGTPVEDGYANVRDVVFAANDARWYTSDEPDAPLRPLDEIAAEQRALVTEALTAFDDEPVPAPAEPTVLPGVGEAL